MEFYIVIGLKSKPDAKGAGSSEKSYQITKAEVEPKAEYEKKFGPAVLDECVKFIKESLDGQTNWFGLTVAQYALIFLVTIAFVIVIFAGAWNLLNFTSIKTGAEAVADQDSNARNLITFLVAVGTIAIAFLAILTAMVLREFKERFALAKEVLTILVGILGTIVGFYFGTAKNENANQSPANTNANTTINGNTNSVNRTNSNTNTNTSAQILRLPSGSERLVSVVYDKSGRRKITLQ